MLDSERVAAGRLIRDRVLEMPEVSAAGTVAAYYSMGTEPDTHGLIFALWKRGSYVVLPVLLPDGDLDWASYEGPDSLAPGPGGVLQPVEPVRGPGTVARADVVLVPALAVLIRAHARVAAPVLVRAGLPVLPWTPARVRFRAADRMVLATARAAQRPRFSISGIEPES